MRIVILKYSDRYIATSYRCKSTLRRMAGGKRALVTLVIDPDSPNVSDPKYLHFLREAYVDSSLSIFYQLIGIYQY